MTEYLLRKSWELDPEGSSFCRFQDACLLLQSVHREGAALFSYARLPLRLQPGAIYRLQFEMRSDAAAQNLAALCLSVQGEEGPDWLYRPLKLERPLTWEAQEVVFAAQAGLNPLDTALLEFRLNNGCPDFSRLKAAAVSRAEERVWIRSLRWERLTEPKRVEGRLGPFLVVPGHDQLRYADVELSLGDGVKACAAEVELICGTSPLTQVAYLEDITGPGQFAYSERSQRIFVSERERGEVRFSYCPRRCRPGLADLAIPELDAGRALRCGSADAVRIPFQLVPEPVPRCSWPVTQGLAFPPGLVADQAAIKLQRPDGAMVPVQVHPTSFWGDDSIRWALLDFQITAGADAAPEYAVCCGEEPAALDSETISLTEDASGIEIDTGPLQFRVSRTAFRLLEDVWVDGQSVPAAMTARVTDAEGLTAASHRHPPYALAVEEAGPLRAVILARGWHTSADGQRLLTYTTRIHAYQGQRFVRVFHSVGNRHDENSMGEHFYAKGWPEDETQLLVKELPQRNIADVSLEIDVPVDTWTLQAGSSDEPYCSGRAADDSVVHRQVEQAAGLLQQGEDSSGTSSAQGIASITGGWGTLTAAVYRYENLFPKELRISGSGLEIGLLPFSRQQPHGLIQGTERTTELLLAFDPPGVNMGTEAAAAFVRGTVLTSCAWYCQSRGFMGDALVPADPDSVGTYDRMMAGYAAAVTEPYGPDIDDCGLMNYGDFPYNGRNVWLNLEYDGDLGLLMHFARTGDGAAFWRAVDASRHFLDADTNWHTGCFDTQGGNSAHDAAHYRPNRPSGHTYTLGLFHYYLLTGDRRALEAGRRNAQLIHRVLYHRIRQYTAAFAAQKTWAVPRGHRVPGGPFGSVNARNNSDPARYSLQSYLVTGEPAFLEATASAADALALDWPRELCGGDDEYIHYRWPQILGRLYELTGAEHYGDLIRTTADWILANPYALYGEYRAAQSYGFGIQVPSRANNTRMLFMTAYAYRLTGERKYLDWMLNMYDGQIEQHRGASFRRGSGKSMGKEGDNPARALAWIVPHRMVLTEPKPARLSVRGPGEAVWQIALANTTGQPLTGTVLLGPLPRGLHVQPQQAFALKPGEEVELSFPLVFEDTLPLGRTTVPYQVCTRSDSREGTRSGFFAIHHLRSSQQHKVERLFHATLADTSPAYSAAGPRKPRLEQPVFAAGPYPASRALGAEAWSFNVDGCISAEQGTVAVWICCGEKKLEHALLRILGCGWPFIGIYTHRIGMGGACFQLAVADRPNHWQHLALSWDPDRLWVYLDGECWEETPRTNLEIPTGKLWALPQETALFADLRIYSAPLASRSIRVLQEGHDAAGKVEE